METFWLGVIWFSAFLLSTTLHEAAHALAALKMGDKTAYFAGQVTVDPLPHIRREPLGMVLVPILSFIYGGYTWMIGWASAPYDPFWARKYPKRAAYMALAGPLANLALVLLSVAAIHLGLYLEIFFEPNQIITSSVVGAYDEGLPATLATFVSVMFSLNLLLFLFNLIPLPPLDGSNLYPFIVGEETAHKIMDFLQQPGIGIIGLVIAWFLFGDIFGPVHLFAINLLYPGLTYE